MLAVLTMARLAMGFQFQSIGSTAPFLVEGLGIDYASVGFLIGLFLLPGVVLAIPGGFLGQVFGDKRVVAFGLALMAGGGLLSAASETYATMLAGRLTAGIGAVFLNVMLTKMTADWFAGREIVLALAILLNAWPIGIGLALVTLGPLAESVSLAQVFQVTAAVAAVGLVLVALLYRPPPDAAGAAGPGLSGLSRREMLLCSLAGIVWALQNATYVIMLGFAPTLMILRGASTAEAGFMVSLSSWILIVSVQAGGMAAKTPGRANAVIVLALAMWSVGLALIPWAPLPAIILIGLCGGLSAAATVALPTEILSPASRGPGLGLFITWYYMAMAGLPPVAGRLLDATGDPRMPLFFGAVLTILAIPVLALFRIGQRRARNREIDG